MNKITPNQQAKKDWRDLLLHADFGYPDAHNYWAAVIMQENPTNMTS